MKRLTTVVVLLSIAILLYLRESVQINQTGTVIQSVVPRVIDIEENSATSTVHNHIPGVVDVVRVIDGDTIVVTMDDGAEEKVRLIGINTPETVDPRKPVQCFGIDASNKMKQLVTGMEVFLKGDKTQTDRDKYGRLLRYVYLPDGTFVNKVMVAEGYAYEYTYRIPYLFQTEFKKAQDNARVQKLGLWADGVCGTNF
ncbi:MAG: thermonuclease family protein [Patescibacteria group bacterium]